MKTPLSVFKQQTGKEVQKTGIWLDSLDGLLPDEQAIVEVKCPYSCRNLTVKDVALKANSCLKVDGKAMTMKNTNISIRFRAKYVTSHAFCEGLSARVHRG